MSHRRALVTTALVALAIGSCFGIAPSVRADGDGEKKMGDDKKPPADATQPSEEKVWPLPFGLAEKDLPEVSMSVETYTSKTGAGTQRITIWGTGKVQLWRTLAQGAKPTILEGTLPVKAFVRLLDLAEAAAIDSWEPLYPAEKQPAGRTFVYKLTRPGHEKVTLVENFEPQSVARISGALRLTASLGRPEAIGDRFFKNF